MHIFLFGGTTEGRRIAEHIAEENKKRDTEGNPVFFETDVFVATDYGAGLLPKEKHISVHVGRLDAEEMSELFGSVQKEKAVVIDATHPYAAVVTENIYMACKEAGLKCIRINRPEVRAENSDFLYFDSVRNAVLWLNSTFRKNPEERKHILITTGSKEIQEYTVIPDFKEYCYVRALPAPEVLEKCMELGFRRDRLIMMQGPFGVDMNLAQMRYAQARYMVTKDSGEIGGFPEKCEAAIELGVKVLVIGRPVSLRIQEEDGYRVMSFGEAVQEVSAEFQAILNGKETN